MPPLASRKEDAKFTGHGLAKDQKKLFPVSREEFSVKLTANGHGRPKGYSLLALFCSFLA